MGRKPIDDETKLKLFSCLEKWNECRFFTVDEQGNFRLTTEEDKIEERELLKEILK